MDGPRGACDDAAAMTPFRCPICHYGAFAVLGRTRLGAYIYTCGKCTVMFADPAAFTNARQPKPVPGALPVVAMQKRGRG